MPRLDSISQLHAPAHYPWPVVSNQCSASEIPGSFVFELTWESPHAETAETDKRGRQTVIFFRTLKENEKRGTFSTSVRFMGDENALKSPIPSRKACWRWLHLWRRRERERWPENGNERGDAQSAAFGKMGMWKWILTATSFDIHGVDLLVKQTRFVIVEVVYSIVKGKETTKERWLNQRG